MRPALLVVSVLLLALLTLLAPPTARADQEAPPTNGDEAARIHYEAGEQHYLRGRYVEAIAEFEEAYRLSGRAELLFNISQSYERLGDIKQARDYLSRYLESGVAPEEERGVLEDKLRAFDKRIAEDDEAERIRLENEKKNRPGPKARPFKTLKWIVAGAGVAFVGAAGIFTLDSSIQSGKVEDAANPEREFDSGLQAAEARGQRDEILAYVFGITGVAAVGVGVLFFVLDRGASDSTPAVTSGASVTPLVGPGLAGAEILWRW